MKRLLGLMSAVSMAGCAATITNQHIQDRIRARAGFDLDCRELNISNLDKTTFGVKGCGKQATYLMMSDSGDSDACVSTADAAGAMGATYLNWFEKNCKVILNTEVRP